MERLTCKRRNFDGYTINCSSACRYVDDCGDCVEFGKLVNRLGAYEDTGLTPEEIEAIKQDCIDFCAFIGECGGVGYAREFAKADKEGRVVVLPCKVGDKLYRVFDGNISEHEVQNMRYFARQGRLGIDMTPFFPDAEKFIGKTVFLTHEEAEEALRRDENG